MSKLGCALGSPKKMNDYSLSSYYKAAAAAVAKLGCALGSPKKMNDYSLSDYYKAAAAAVAKLGCALGSPKKMNDCLFYFLCVGKGGTAKK